MGIYMGKDGMGGEVMMNGKYDVVKVPWWPDSVSIPFIKHLAKLWTTEDQRTIKALGSTCGIIYAKWLGIEW